MTVSEAGGLGGRETLCRHGRRHFTRIGQRGQAAMREKYPGMSRVWGRMGGRPRKKTLAEIHGQESNTTRKE